MSEVVTVMSSATPTIGTTIAIIVKGNAQSWKAVNAVRNGSHVTLELQRVANTGIDKGDSANDVKDKTYEICK